MQQTTPTYAGLGIRAIAFGTDYLLILVYLILLTLTGAIIYSFFPALQMFLFGDPIQGQVAGFLTVTLPVTLYFMLCESSHWQATWGKHKFGLTVTRTDGRPLSRLRALARTALKFLPWELSHTCIWQLQGGSESLVLTAGLTLVWILAGIYALSLLISSRKQTVYDLFTDSIVVKN